MQLGFRSLKSRILLSMVLLTIVVVPSLMLALEQAFKQHITQATQNEMLAQSYSILALAEVENGQLLLPEQLLEPQFNVINSGLYGMFIDSDGNVLWQTESALEISFPTNIKVPEAGQTLFADIELGLNSNKQAHFVFTYSVIFDDGDTTFPAFLHIIRDQTEINASIQSFRQQLAIWMVAILVVLGLVQLVWFSWTLKPLARFKKELQAIENGDEREIKGHYPRELEQVTHQLNQLLHIEQQQRVKYRNALADLAHSLKTPLAVIHTKLDNVELIANELNQINQSIEHQLKRAQSAGDTSWRLGCNLNEAVDELLSALSKIYRDKNISFTQHIPDNTVFKGDKADLTEILGNLLDNACKATISQVEVSAFSENNTLVLTIEDDGAGVSEQEKTRILKRGNRADTYEQGHGIGLSIVKDLIDSYGGKLSIEKSEWGGAKFTLTFS